MDIIIGCSLQRSDTHDALEIFGRFCAYNCNAYLVRASVSLDGQDGLCGCSMIVTPKGKMLVNMKSERGMGVAEFDPKDKYYKPAGFGNPPAAHYEYIEFGRNPWQYRPGGSAIVRHDEIMPYPRVCAHRGFSTVAPENSMPAFGAAVSLGAEEIEFDLRYTKDGVVVSCHDNRLERISDGEGIVSDKTFEELSVLDFGAKFSDSFKGLRIVKFEDILQKFSCHTVMNIHIKSVKGNEEYEREIVKKIVELVDRYDCRKYVYFMSEFDHILGYLCEIAPDIPRCCGFDGNADTFVDRALKYGCKKIQLFKPHFDQAMIDRAHDNGLICNVFWSDDPEETVRFLDMGIDVILSNDYGRIARTVEEYKKGKRR